MALQAAWREQVSKLLHYWVPAHTPTRSERTQTAHAPGGSLQPCRRLAGGRSGGGRQRWRYVSIDLLAADECRCCLTAPVLHLAARVEPSICLCAPSVCKQPAERWVGAHMLTVVRQAAAAVGVPWPQVHVSDGQARSPRGWLAGEGARCAPKAATGPSCGTGAWGNALRGGVSPCCRRRGPLHSLGVREMVEQPAH